MSFQIYKIFILSMHSKKGTVFSIDCKNLWIPLVPIEFQIEQFFRDIIFLDRPPFRFPKKFKIICEV